MKIWLVGSSGLASRSMQTHLTKRGIPFVASSHIEADILNPDALHAYYEEQKPTHIVNCAAYVNVDKAEEERDLAFMLNVDGPFHLASLAKHKGCRFVHIGTDYVFDGMKKGAYEESDPTNTVNHYGWTKLEGERRILEVYPKSVSLRTASIYGLEKSGLVSNMLDQLINKEEVKTISDQSSSPTYTKDLCEGIMAVLDQTGIYHYVNKWVVSRLDLLVEIRNIALSLDIPLACKKIVPVTQEEIKRPAMRPRLVELSTKKMEKLLGHPIRSGQAALREYLEEYVKNMIAL